MNISLLKTFLEVARLRHFSKAAESVCLTQSAVSARIKLLEESLGSTLLVRRRNDIQLTPAGRRLAMAADQIIKQWEQAKREIELTSDDEQILIRLGILPDLWSIFGEPWFMEIHAQHPELLFQLQGLSGPLLQERLLADELDLAILFDPPYQSSFIIMETTTLTLALVASQPLQLGTPTELEYIYVNWGSHFAEQHHQIEDQLTPALSMNQGSMALAYLQKRGGLAYLPLPMVDDAIRRGELFLVEGAPLLQRPLFITYSRTNRHQALLATLLK